MTSRRSIEPDTDARPTAEAEAVQRALDAATGPRRPTAPRAPGTRRDTLRRFPREHAYDSAFEQFGSDDCLLRRDLYPHVADRLVGDHGELEEVVYRLTRRIASDLARHPCVNAPTAQLREEQMLAARWLLERAREDRDPLCEQLRVLNAVLDQAMRPGPDLDAVCWENLSRLAYAIRFERTAPRWWEPFRAPDLEPAVVLPDPAASRAVFVGVGRSPGLADLPEAEASATELADCLTPVARATVLLGENATGEQIRRALTRAADEASDLLVLHVAGHGNREPGTDQLTLATADAAIPLAELRDLATATRARRILVVLDACETSGADIKPWKPRADSAVYMVTATGGEPALARNPVRGGGTTAFTGALIAALTRGAASYGETLDVPALYSVVDRWLQRDTLPRPRMYAWGGEPDRWALARNRHPRATAPLRTARPDPELPALLARARAGDTEAWDGLVERYGNLVWSTVRAFHLPPSLSANAANRTWLRLVEHLETVTADTIAAFLTANARTESVHALRTGHIRAARSHATACDNLVYFAQSLSCDHLFSGQPGENASLALDAAAEDRDDDSGAPGVANSNPRAPRNGIGTLGRPDRDEVYVLDLCDEVLGEAGLRQHRFDWLTGDPGKNGRRRKLPVDGYWPGAATVVEYRELQHERPVKFFDKPDVLTVSGVHRGVQRALYDARRDTLIPAHGLRLVVIRPSDLASTSNGRLYRRRESDIEQIRRLLDTQGTALDV